MDEIEGKAGTGPAEEEGVMRGGNMEAGFSGLLDDAEEVFNSIAPRIIVALAASIRVFILSPIWLPMWLSRTIRKVGRVLWLRTGTQNSSAE